MTATADDGRGPLVSILTPSLNQGRFIADCIASVDAQTYRPIEHVIYDGGSCDDTLELLRRAPSHVRWRSEPDRGQAHALNKALEASRGEYVGWINSDDAYADRRTVERTVEVLEHHPEVAVVFGHALLVNENNVVLQLIWTPRAARALLRFAHYIYQPTIFFRRDALENQPSFLREDLDFVFDRELLLRLLETERFYRIDHVVAIDRHQRQRKVETKAYRREAEMFDASIGIESTRRSAFVGRALKLGLRLAGVPRTGCLPDEVDAAIELRWPPRRERFRLQMLTTRDKMPFASH